MISHSSSHLPADTSAEDALSLAMQAREESKKIYKSKFSGNKNEWHIDPDCDKAIIRLNDALCSEERMTGNENALFIIPQYWDERIIISQNGKPLPDDMSNLIENLLIDALFRRGEINEEDMDMCFETF